ncbi:Thioredoxin reductase [Variovorax sp. YR750]|uniref:hypothetical protein n=1 Tax=Variovorax sp. YR750 TaxID=1884384 RepID=UPI0008BDD64A|nr:hypothetical protein [Variovorax sp. YR750]SEK42395.1 Thioredoxin reductase [Variovorax sp. YR750]
MPRTVVIGCGISAAAYLMSASRTLGTVIGVGGPDLWKQIAPTHKMGQPAPLLTGNLLSGPRGFNAPPQPGATPFMLAGNFADLVEYHFRSNTHFQFPGSLVDSIRRLPNGQYEVCGRVWSAKLPIFCDNVIIAVGPGPARPLMVGENGDIGVDVRNLDGYVVGGTEFMSPHWKMPRDEDTRGKTIAVYGGSATAAWVVELAKMRGMNVVRWFTRPGNGGDAWNVDVRFEAAFPAGSRNTEVRESTRDQRAVLKLTNIKIIRPHVGSPFLGLEFVDQMEQVIRLPVDLLVYALGAAHTRDTGIRAMLDRDTQAQLVAYYDRNLAISSRPSLLAVGTGDGSLMIVGSAMCSTAGFGTDMKLQGDPERTLATLARYTDISNTLPPAARPPEGIGMIMAGIEALNDFMPVRSTGGAIAVYRRPHGQGLAFHDLAFVWTINFNTSNRTQLAAFLASVTDLPQFAANVAVALIVKLRTRAGNVLGLSRAQVQLIVWTSLCYAHALAALNHDLEAKRLWSDKNHGADRFVDMCVDYMTTEGTHVAYWARHSINC